jgi:hypothetical protein
MTIQINLFHILVIGPVLLLIDAKGAEKPETDMRISRRDLWVVLATLVICMLFFVGIPIPELGWGSWYNMISLIHYAGWFWLFGWLAWLGIRDPDMVPSWTYPLFRWLGIMVIVVHLYLLVTK